MLYNLGRLQTTIGEPNIDANELHSLQKAGES